MRIIQSDDEAFTMLYEQYHDSIYTVALRYIKDPDAAQDIVQHVFLRLWENRASLSVNLNLRNYLITMAVNKIKNYIRDNNVAVRGNYEWAQMRLSNTNILEKLHFEGQVTDLMNAIKQLPDQRREICLLKLNDLTNQEIADKMGLTIQTVKNHYSLALKQLKDLLVQPQKIRKFRLA